MNKQLMIDGLTDLFDKFGVEILNDANRFKAGVSDFICGDMLRLERRIVLFAYEADIYPQLLKAHKNGNHDRDVVRHVMFRKLTEDLCFREDYTLLSIEVLSSALGWDAFYVNKVSCDKVPTTPEKNSDEYLMANQRLVNVLNAVATVANQRLVNVLNVVATQKIRESFMVELKELYEHATNNRNRIKQVLNKVSPMSRHEKPKTS